MGKNLIPNKIACNKSLFFCNLTYTAVIPAEAGIQPIKICILKKYSDKNLVRLSLDSRLRGNDSGDCLSHKKSISCNTFLSDPKKKSTLYTMIFTTLTSL